MKVDDIFLLPLSTGIYDTSPKMVKLYQESGATSDGFPEFVACSQKENYLRAKLNNLINNAHRYRPHTFSDKDHDLIFKIAQEVYQLVADKYPSEISVSGNQALFKSSKISIELNDAKVCATQNLSSDFHQEVFNYLAQTNKVERIFDALALHLQEDFAITARDIKKAPPNDYLELAHICFPSHWDPRHKVGKNFSDIHKPVTNNTRLLKAHRSLVSAMFERGPFNRFVWGIAHGPDLDCHPEHIATKGPQVAKEMAKLDNLFFRVERQVTYPLPKVYRSFFTIRVFMKPLCEVAKNPAQKSLLHRALLSMNSEALSYKNLTTLRDPIVKYLDSFPTDLP